MSRQTLVLICLVLSAAVCGADVETQPDAPLTKSTKVSLADLNLTTAEGARTAGERVHEAVRRVCSRVAESTDVGRARQVNACINETLASALRQIAMRALEASKPKDSAPLASRD